MATQHESRVLSTPNSTMIATGIISNIIYITEVQNKPNVALHSLKGFSGLFALNTFRDLSLWYFQRIRDVNFTINLTQAREFIRRFYHIFQGYSCKNLHFPNIKHCLNYLAIKRRRKSVDSSPKWFLWTSKQLFAIHFLLATCNVCPLTIPEFSALTRISDYWQIIGARLSLRVFHLPRDSGNSGWVVIWFVPLEIFWNKQNLISEKVVPFSRWKFVFHFFSSLSPVPYLSRSFKRPGLPRLPRMQLVTKGKRPFQTEIFRIF